MRRWLPTLWAMMFWLVPALASAETQRSIASSRVTLGDLVADAPVEIAGVDLGPAPPVGSSRLYTTEDVAAAARQVGHRITIKDSIRVTRATKRWMQSELLDFLTPQINTALPSYAKLLRVDVPRSLVTVTNVDVARIDFGQLPNRAGTHHTSVLVEMIVDGHTEQRLSLPAVLALAERPKPVELARGTGVSLVIRLGTATVSTAATTLQPAAIGATVLCRVVKTRKILRAKLLTSSTAEVVNE